LDKRDLTLKRSGCCTVVLLSHHEPCQDDNPIAWVHNFKLLINLSRKPDADQNARIERLKAQGLHLMGMPSPSGQVVLDEIYNSREPVTTAYARYEHLLRPPYYSPYK
jgi:hypothetical protein